MTEWLSKDEKERLVEYVERKYESGMGEASDVLKAKMELDAVEAALRAANASERNAKIMLWATGCAAASAIANFLAVFAPLLIKH